MESEVIENKEVVPGDLIQFFEVSTICFVVEELGEEFRSGGEEDFESFDTSGVTDSGGEEGFSHAGWSCDEQMFTSLNEVTGCQLVDIGLDESLSIGRKINLFKDGILSEPGLVEQVLTSSIVPFFPFGLNQIGQYFIGTGGLECAAFQGGLISITHSVEPHLSE